MKPLIVSILLLICFSHSVRSQNDCPEALFVCGDSRYWGLVATGVGSQQELGPNACNSSENNSIWLKVLIDDGGTLGFVITPESSALVVDFDFWLFGPVDNCQLGTAIRCSTTNPLQAQLNYNITGMDDIATDVAEGPGPDGNAWVNWITAPDDAVYYLVVDRPVGSSDFTIEWTGTATFHEMPEFLNPDNITLDIVQCDTDGVNDNATTFNLTIHEEMFIGQQDDVAITYHTSSNDAILGINTIADPENFINTSTSQSIYLRMENQATGCYTNEVFTISMSPPLPGTPSNLTRCDTAQNGIQQFDLSLNDPAITNGNTGCVVTYHTSQEEAHNGTSPIGTLYFNATPYQTQTIWARLSKNAGCVGYAVTSFTISVVPLPAINNPQNISLTLRRCDDDGVDDQSGMFDLTQHETLLAGNQQNISFSYFTTLNDAATASNAIATPAAYSNVSNPQIIYLRMLNTVTGCFDVESFSLEITNMLEAGQPINLVLCDVDGDGFQEFNFLQNNALINNGNSQTTITFYGTETDAESEQDPLPTTYQNLLPYATQTVWARLESTGGCFGYDIVSFTISVVPLPEFSNPQNISLNLVRCDSDAVDDNSTLFNLTAHEPMLTGSQANLNFTYYLSEQDANTVANEIATPAMYANVSNPQTIYIRVQNSFTGCFAVSSFAIEVSPGITAGEPQPLSMCDNNSNGFQAFDLSQNTTNIQNGNTGTTVAYYASVTDAETETDPLPVTYQNQVAYESETIWGRLESTEGCFGYVLKPFTITVQPLPEFNNPQNMLLDLAKCDDDSIDDKSTAFDLTTHTAMFIGNQTGVSASYHTSLDDAELGSIGISNPQNFANTTNPQQVFVRLENGLTGCYKVSSFDLEVVNPVIAGQPLDLNMCDLHDNGLQWFNLSQNDALIKDGNTNAAVHYYASEEDAENEVNPLSPVHVNAVPYNQQQIWARLENSSGCFGHDITSFYINVDIMPAITYDIDIVDFTETDNTISISLYNNNENYEFSIDGVNYKDSNVFDGLAPGLYTIYIRSKNGCQEVEDQVVILNYPKFFTPNGDGVNESWTIPYLSLLPDAQVYIFDRYGKLITGYPGINPGWDGNLNGHALPATDYWFTLELEDGRMIKGHFAMIR